MDYKQTLDYIHSIPKFVRPLGNKNLTALLSELNNPQDRLKCIHIAGTNGKGSTAAILSSILSAQGYKTGLFTSPFIEVFNERIQINGNNISDDDLCLYAERVKGAMEETGFSVSEFAFICAVAFLYFYEQAVDFVVLEVGMGGALDATNIIKCPLVSVITSISLDHMEYLGETIVEIAKEKCGIIKENSYAVSQKNSEVRDIIKAAAKEKHSELIFTDKSEKTENGFLYKGREYEMPLMGDYQKDNGAAALETVSVLREQGIIIDDRAVYEGIKNVKWPVRFEFVRDNIVIDGGHNIDGVKAVKQSLNGRKYAAVIAMMADKQTNECMRIISDGAEFVIATQIPMPRCESAKELAKCTGAEFDTDYKRAIDKAINRLNDDTILCICGSLYFAAEAKKYLREIVYAGQSGADMV